MIEKTLTLKNAAGLHARPAGEFVAQATKFESAVTLKYNDQEVNAKSMLFVLSLAIPMGAEFTIVADGSDENEAIEVLAQLVEDGLGE